MAAPEESKLAKVENADEVVDEKLVADAAKHIKKTLEEMAVENRAVFLDAGGLDYRFIPCLNDRDDHVRMMRELVLRA